MKRSLIIICIAFPLIGLFTLMNTILTFADSVSVSTTFTVNSYEDKTDANPGDGICETASTNGECTLRAAVQESNFYSDVNTINLPTGSYTLTIAGDDEDLSATGDLDIVHDLIITGSDKSTTFINGGAIDRVIDVTVQTATVEIMDLTIINGLLSTSSIGGSGIRNRGLLTISNTDILSNVTSIENHGGGITNYGTAEIINCEIKFNKAYEYGGGGIYNTGIMSITNSAISENLSSGGHGGGIHVADGSIYIQDTSIFDNNGFGGGGIYSYSYHGTAKIHIHSSTIANNYAYGGGGGISSGLNSHFDIINSTISNNRSSYSYSGGGIRNQGAHITVTQTTIYSNTRKGVHSSSPNIIVKNSIIANNWDGNCSGFDPVVSDGYNLSSDNSCTFTNTGDINNEAAYLLPLSDNGGPTLTHALSPASPALQKIPNGTNGCGTTTTTDQRGVTRPIEYACEIGSVEAFPFDSVYIQQLLNDLDEIRASKAYEARIS